MARKSRGVVVERSGKRGTSFALRFMADGKRRNVYLGTDYKDGWTRAKAEDELAFIMGQVQRGTWKPDEEPEFPDEPRPVPTFGEFAGDWLAGLRGRKRDRTIEDYTGSIEGHLIPHFRDYRLDEIDYAEIDRYVQAKTRQRTDKLVERPLSNRSINKTLIRLGQVLDEAVLHEHIAAHPLAVKSARAKLRLPEDEPRRVSLDAHQAEALLACSGRHKPMIATALMAGGLRVSELINVRWRDVDLNAGRLRVLDSKTKAGVREVDVSAPVRKLLAEHKLRQRWSAPSDFVFPGKHRKKPRDRRAVPRLLKRIAEKTNAKLEAEGWDPIPSGVCFHSLRHTYATLMAERGEHEAYTMRQMGHRKAAFTMEVYTHVGSRRDREAGALDDLLTPGEVAQVVTTPLEPGFERRAASEA